MCDTFVGNYHDSENELVGQGAGNIMSGLFGGVAGAGATVRTGMCASCSAACCAMYHIVDMSGLAQLRFDT